MYELRWESGEQVVSEDDEPYVFGTRDLAIDNAVAFSGHYDSYGSIDVFDVQRYGKKIHVGTARKGQWIWVAKVKHPDI